MKLLALFVCLVVVTSAAAQPPGGRVVGQAFGQDVREYSLQTGRIHAKILDYGGIVRELHVPDRKGQPADVVCGFDTVEEYVAGNPYFGCITGRVANRIARGQFTLDGKPYTLAVNNDPNHLHGGVRGFDKRVWTSHQPAGNVLKLKYTSPAGEEGYPGQLTIEVTYTITQAGEWQIDYEATTDQPTIINLTQHSYFNLAGHAASDIRGHELQLFADKFTACDKTLIPTGELRSVEGTPFDFRQPTKIGSRIQDTGLEPAGYDLNYVIRPDGKRPTRCARVRDPQSGRVMDVFTTEPGVQLYTANHQTGQTIGKGKVKYQQYCGLCLECQHFPDSINQPKFPSIVLRPGEVYRQTTIYQFSTE